MSTANNRKREGAEATLTLSVMYELPRTAKVEPGIELQPFGSIGAGVLQIDGGPSSAGGGISGTFKSSVGCCASRASLASRRASLTSRPLLARLLPKRLIEDMVTRVVVVFLCASYTTLSVSFGGAIVVVPTCTYFLSMPVVGVTLWPGMASYRPHSAQKICVSQK